MRAVEYFTASIRQDCSFPAFPCSSWKEFKEGKCLKNLYVEDASLMGMGTEQHVEQKQPLYLTTLPESPFCGTLANYRLLFYFLSMVPKHKKVVMVTTCS